MYQCLSHGYDSGYDLVLTQAFSASRDEVVREVCEKTLRYGCTRSVVVNKVDSDGKVTFVESFGFYVYYGNEMYFMRNGERFDVNQYETDLDALMHWLNS